MEFLVIGCGSIGQRHISNLKLILPDSNVDVFDNDKKQIKMIQKKYHVISIKEQNLMEKKYDCVLVCTPPSTHVDYAIKAIKNNSNVFIEKPISNTINKLENLVQLKNKFKTRIFVGYVFRFNKGLNHIKEIIEQKKYGRVTHVSSYFGQYLPDWRPSQNYKKSYTTQKELGGGIIYDSSHEINYLTWMFGQPNYLQSNYTQTDILDSDSEAICNVILKFKNNVLGTIHLDYVRRQYKRTLEVLLEHGILEWSLSPSEVKIFDAFGEKTRVINTDEKINDMYVEELKHVINCIKYHKDSKIIGLESGIQTLKLSNLIKKSKNC